MHSSSSSISWAQIARHLATREGKPCFKINKWRVEHPQEAGLKQSLGLPVGQMADWRLPSPNCHGLHVREFETHYTAHIDRKNPNCDLVGHLQLDTPAVGGSAALGAMAGLILGESAGAMLVGALVGGALGAAATSSAENNRCAKGKKPV